MTGLIAQGPLHVPSHKPMFRAMIQVGHAGLDLFSALYSHNLALARPCAMFAYERTTIMLNGYCVLAARSLHHWQLCAWSLVPKVHMVRHMSLELQLQLQAGASYVLSPLATACDMNEDMVGRMCKLYVAVESREMMQQILQLYLVKAGILQRRTAKRLHIRRPDARWIDQFRRRASRNRVWAEDSARKSRNNNVFF